MSPAFAVHYETVSLARKNVPVDRRLTRNLVRSRTDRSRGLDIFDIFSLESILKGRDASERT
jgi:hypothetical protein